MVTRLALLYLSVSFLLVGVWAQCWPQSFYMDFPGFGRAWVRLDGPFNEHLMRDVGGLNLGLGLAALFALRVPHARVIQAVCLAMLAYSLPHYGYHLTHLSLLPSGFDAVANSVLLGVNVFLPCMLMLTARASSPIPD